MTMSVERAVRGLSRAPEIWGGVECTVNRIADRQYDQIARSGHEARLGDVDLFADLGIRTLRFPLVWERMQPERSVPIDWTHSDRALHRVRQRTIRPILGLLHHGYGPSWTGLLDPEFPTKFAQYALAVAQRYPWVEAYTPINEPLTTARFSGLYGHWHPHAYDADIFAQLLLAQCKAIAEAMRAVRTVNAAAQLVQTEDLGNVTGSSTLAYQCEFENERRWLTWDLLSGAVDPTHAMWTYLRAHGVAEHSLWDFVETPCAPDLIGVNYYVTSERYLDDRLERYPNAEIGGNESQRYVDIATARAPGTQLVGIEALLREVWTRYSKPVAVTECHIGCTREEQLRWLDETWTAAQNLCTEGVDIRAVTTWALLGLHDWDSLMARDDGHYEPGAFDIRAPQPRPTALAGMVKALATRGTYSHAVLRTPGWWRRKGRLAKQTNVDSRGVGESVLITGAHGTLGSAIARSCEARGIIYSALPREILDIADPVSVSQALARYRPWAVINAAGYVDVDAAEHNQAQCWRDNVIGATMLATMCEKHNTPLVTYSSDLVFDGGKRSAYVESDRPNPLNHYGLSKLSAERGVLTMSPSALVLRTSAFFGPWDRYNIVSQALYALRDGRPFRVPNDIVITPTYVPDLAHVTLDLLLDQAEGVWHLCNETPMTWSALIRQVAERMEISTDTLVACPVAQLNLSAPRPTNSVLTSERGWPMPTLDDAITRYVDEMSEQFATGVASELMSTPA